MPGRAGASAGTYDIAAQHLDSLQKVRNKAR